MDFIILAFLVVAIYAVYKSQRELWFGVKEPAAQKTLDEQIAELSPAWQETIRIYREKSIPKKLDIDL